ncbi:photosynthetic complex assembly protein PuhC [Variovorax sp. J22R133]|uniref:photosynthetic complex assembly protein PuhC n=1 Tax=Variovorax brevis TaxID=3053503 RepID=UPI002578E02A|nr:photosynthetic complex assembly protein PuhC [Variovorax sp. J22R133]MDM0113806.1 photosynthetic complex assembly protein PuhC [Variovorax sp. J22R133]
MQAHASSPSRGALPRGVMAALGLMVLASLLTVIFVRLTGVGVMHVEDAPAVSVREFRFEDRADGGIDVLDARSGRVVHAVAPETNGFLRGTMRGLARERYRRGIGPEVPFRMIGRADGKLTLEDPTTGRRVDLGSFGPSNAAVFASLMQQPAPAPKTP